MGTDEEFDRSRATAWVVSGLLAASIVAGVLLGAAARVAMRWVAIDAGLDPGFSIGGSIEVIAFGVLIGSPVALGLGAAACRWRLPHGSGLAAASALLIVLSVVPPPAARSAIATVPDSMGQALAVFAGAFLLYGLSLELLVHRCRKRRRFQRRSARRRSR